MHYNTLFIGMDVHKETFTLCCYDMQQDRVFATQKMEANCNQVFKYLTSLRKIVGNDVDLVCGYEAGCLGFTLYHQLAKFDIKCIILAPTTMMKAGKNTVKTDKRPVHIPTEQDEQVKEFIRMRDDHKLALKKVKQQILAFCLRHGYIYSATKNHWTNAHLSWLNDLKLEESIF